MVYGSEKQSRTSKWCARDSENFELKFHGSQFTLMVINALSNSILVLMTRALWMQHILRTITYFHLVASVVDLRARLITTNNNRRWRKMSHVKIASPRMKTLCDFSSHFKLDRFGFWPAFRPEKMFISVNRKRCPHIYSAIFRHRFHYILFTGSTWN